MLVGEHQPHWPAPGLPRPRGVRHARTFRLSQPAMWCDRASRLRTGASRLRRGYCDRAKIRLRPADIGGRLVARDAHPFGGTRVVMARPGDRRDRGRGCSAGVRWPTSAVPRRAEQGQFTIRKTRQERSSEWFACARRFAGHAQLEETPRVSISSARGSGLSAPQAARTVRPQVNTRFRARSS